VTWLAMCRHRLSSSRRPLVSLAVVCCVSLALALGRYTGLYDWVTALPFLGQMRVPARFTLFFHIAGAIVLALAFADLLEAGGQVDDGRKRARRWIWLAPASSLAIALIALATAKESPLPSEMGRSIANMRLVLLGPALSMVAAALWYAAARGMRPALVGLILFVAADQAAYGAMQLWTVPPQPLDEFVASVPKLPNREAGRVAMGFSDRVLINQKGDVIFYAASRHMLHDTNLVGGYGGLMPRKVLEPFAPKTLEIAGTAYVLRREGFVAQEDPLPRFRLVSDAQTAFDLPSQLDTLDVRSTAVVEGPIELIAGPPGTARVERERPGDIQLSVEAPTRQLLVVAESFHPGWAFEVDGAPAPVLRVYGDFMGTPIEPGEHEVGLHFRPRSLSTGLALSGAGLVLLAGAGIMALRNGPGTGIRPGS